MAGLMRLRPMPQKTTYWKTSTAHFTDLKPTQLKDIRLPFTATLHPFQWNSSLQKMINSFCMVDLYFMGHMMVMVMAVHLHFQFHFQQKGSGLVNSHLKLYSWII